MAEFEAKCEDLYKFYYETLGKRGFCVSLDKAFPLCGYSGRAQAKRKLLKLAFKPKEGVDYILKPVTKTKGRGGFNRQHIWMTSRTFQEFALTADTKEAGALIDKVFTLSNECIQLMNKLRAGEVKIVEC